MIMESAPYYHLIIVMAKGIAVMAVTSKIVEVSSSLLYIAFFGSSAHVLIGGYVVASQSFKFMAHILEPGHCIVQYSILGVGYM